MTSIASNRNDLKEGRGTCSLLLRGIEEVLWRAKRINSDVLGRKKMVEN